ncbi:MAG TPA: hypothetical protein VFV01_36320 [Spirillospora sp.]|nr:hypothetical protein [Spirillospora sp.]
MPSSVPKVPGYEEFVADLRALRRHGLARLRWTELPALASAARSLRPPGDAPEGPDAPEAECRPAELEGLLRRAADGLQGNLGDAAAYVFGLAPGTRDWTVGDRRRRAAQVYGVGTERFRKHHEPLIVSEVADRLGELCRRAPAGPAPGAPAVPGVMRLTGRLGGRPRPVTLHAMPVELVTGVDIVVSPCNMHLELPQAFKNSVSASLRRSGARVGPIGEVLDDAVHRELAAWVRRNARPGLPVAPGTVAPTGPGELRSAGLRRIYHAAVTAPRLRDGGYDVPPGAVAGAVRNVFAVAAAENRECTPPLRSVCLPLLGAGRGGLPPYTSFSWIWTALERTIGGDDAWDLHFVARSAPGIDAIVRGLGRHA